MAKEVIKNLADCNISKLGCKLICYACHGTFYDLQQIDPVCPYCQSQYSKTIKKRKLPEASQSSTLEILDELDTDESEIDIELL